MKQEIERFEGKDGFERYLGFLSEVKDGSFHSPSRGSPSLTRGDFPQGASPLRALGPACSLKKLSFDLLAASMVVHQGGPQAAPVRGESTPECPAPYLAE